jgi:hypothetical protein
MCGCVRPNSRASRRAPPFQTDPALRKENHPGPRRPQSTSCRTNRSIKSPRRESRKRRSASSISSSTSRYQPASARSCISLYKRIGTSTRTVTARSSSVYSPFCLNTARSNLPNRGIVPLRMASGKPSRHPKRLLPYALQSGEQVHCGSKGWDGSAAQIGPPICERCIGAARLALLQFPQAET